MKDNLVRDKSYAFAIRIVKLYKYLCDEKKEFVLSHQILKSGTSPGANESEAEFAQSKKDFISKMSIGLKEANETLYFLKLLFACLLYTSDAADERSSVDLGGRRIIKKKKYTDITLSL